MKKLILVASPPACGKTRLSKRLAVDLKNVVYLDKDSVIPLSKRVFKAAHRPYNRSSAFFGREIRDYEYEVIVNIGVDNLKYNDRVIINAPFTKEIRDLEYISNLKSRVEKFDAELVVVWINSTAELCKKHMIKRNSDRDRWKITHFDDYIKDVNFAPPPIDDKTLFVLDGTSDEKYEQCYLKLIKIIGR